MGVLYYGSQRVAVRMDDRLLAHLKVVILNKMQRREAFALNIRESNDSGSGRHTLWLHPAADLHFEFEGSRPPALDRDLITEFSNAASSPRGVEIDQGATIKLARR